MTTPTTGTPTPTTPTANTMGRAGGGRGLYGPARVALWLVTASAVALAPLLIALAGPRPDGRPYLVELGVGLGFVGMGLLVVQLLTTGRFQWVAPVFGSDVVLQFHKRAGLAAFVLVAAHPVLTILADPDYLAFLDPTVNLLRAVFLVVALAAVTALVVSSLWRTTFGLSYEAWRAAHGALAVTVVAIGAVHGIQVSRHLATIWQQVLWAVIIAVGAYLVVHSRLTRPWLARRRPWEVTAVEAELDDTFTLTLEPVGHHGLPHRAGQFAWVTLGPSPLRLQQHPFSISSRAQHRHVRLTAKALGDFTSTWRDVPIGTRAWLEGPYGGFVADPAAAGLVWIAGGIGITPFIAMARSMRDRGDAQRVILIYATSRLDRAPFAAELKELSVALNLEIHHVLEEPPEGWAGATGYVDRDLLDAVLPADRHQLGYYLCGPEPLMDAGERALRSLGLSWRQIYSERFQIV